VTESLTELVQRIQQNCQELEDELAELRAMRARLEEKRDTLALDQLGQRLSEYV
jgi:predicted nuclease with TOPRIM domain